MNPLKKLLPKKKGDVDMTEGSILRHIISFSIPLLIGYIFQQLYNTVDTWVVGNYVSDGAFAAVGTVAPIINTLIGLFMGISSGAGVVISQYYGANDSESVSRAVHTSIVLTVILGVVFTAAGIAMTPLMLDLINMPSDAFQEAKIYLTVYFAGVIGLMLYNIGAGILRAVGDSVTPFYFLVLSAVMNIVLDLVFVLWFDMGVAGVAVATVISQCVSAALVLLLLFKSKNAVRLRINRLKLDVKMLGSIVKIGIPSGLQMAITAFSNIFVTSYINYFGSECAGGWTAYSRIDQFVLIPINAISLATTTFVGQNLGREQLDRAKQGVKKALIITLTTTVMLGAPVMIFAPNIVYFFNKNPLVIEYGAIFLRALTPFYLACCTAMILTSALRGAGNTVTPMIIMLSSYVLFRQCYLFVVSNYISNTEIAIAAGYPAGWCIACIANIIYYKFVGISNSRVVTRKNA